MRRPNTVNRIIHLVLGLFLLAFLNISIWISIWTWWAWCRYWSLTSWIIPGCFIFLISSIKPACTVHNNPWPSCTVAVSLLSVPSDLTPSQSLSQLYPCWCSSETENSEHEQCSAVVCCTDLLGGSATPCSLTLTELLRVMTQTGF